MPKFAYIAVDAAGKESRGTIEAPNQAQAVAKVRSQGLFPTAIGVAGGSDAATARPAAAAKKSPAAKKSLAQTRIEIKLPKFLRGKVKQKDLTTFTRQLATLVDAGLPLLRGLHVLQRQTPNAALKDALAGMCESVESGSTFSESLTNYPKIFDNLYVNMVKAGEAGGVLEVVLNRLAEFAEKAAKIKNKVKSAMVYPVVVLVAAVGITGFLLVAVIPKFKDIFNDLLEGKPLPAITQFVMDASNLVMNNGLAVVAAFAALFVLFKIFAKTRFGRYLLDVSKINAPMFGSLVRRTAIARMTRTLGTLLASGVPVLQALNIVRDTTGNEVISRAMQNVHDAVKEGESMTNPLAACKVFPPMVISMVEVGEETGALPDMLTRIAETYDDEVDNAVAGLTSVIEPIMIIILAVVVGTIVIAMFMPMIQIIGSLGAQA
ncbi:MAG TPA: type II secretion system F family protein [Kiritimatiellia bacterium]|jgi:type IV pilus assembly protein PilC|nr:type II secretion system F family protein [Kiritimatiellia bacterium]HOR98041.1 type II secretion system F family protein [Kiritimatiellia bacterium]HRU19963.1 type II secretion system F family protein [Kiritimatiellia bacterium]